MMGTLELTDRAPGARGAAKGCTDCERGRGRRGCWACGALLRARRIREAARRIMSRLQSRRRVSLRSVNVNLDAGPDSPFNSSFNSSKVTSPPKTSTSNGGNGSVQTFFEGEFHPKTPRPAVRDRRTPRRVKKAVPKAEHTSQWQWLRRISGITWTAEMGRPRSRLLHPHYPLIQFFRGVTSVLLVYVALVVQVEVGFFWHVELCEVPNSSKTTFDMCVDAYFLFEIILNFFTGIFVDGAYTDRMSVVAYRYATSGLLFDCVTSVPVSVLEFIAREKMCGSMADKSAALNQDFEDLPEIRGLKLMRALKPLRLFKLLKLMRAQQVMIWFERTLTALHVPVFVARMANTFMRCGMVVHTCTCVYWLVKESSCTEEEIDFFLRTHNLEDPDSLIQKYSLAFYFVNTIFSTVGFGDIVAVNTAERWVLVFVMYVGVIVFGTLLSEVQTAIADVYHAQMERASVLNSVKGFLSSADVPKAMRDTILSWLEIDFYHQQRMKQQQEVIEYIPDALRPALIGHLHNSALYRIPFLRELSSKDRTDFVLALFAQMTPHTAPSGNYLVNRLSKPDRLHLIVQGSVDVKLYDGSTVATLYSGDVFGFFGLVSEDSCYLTGKI